MEGSMRFDQTSNEAPEVKADSNVINGDQKKIYIELNKQEKEDLEYLNYLHNNPNISDFGLEHVNKDQDKLENGVIKKSEQTTLENKNVSKDIEEGVFTNKQLLLDIITDDGVADDLMKKMVLSDKKSDQGKIKNLARPISWNTKEVFLRMHGKDYPEIRLEDIKELRQHKPDSQAFKKIEKIESVYKDPVYLSMLQNYLKGMSVNELIDTYVNHKGEYFDDEVDSVLKKSSNEKVVISRFLNDVGENKKIKKEKIQGETKLNITSPDPAARMMTEILLKQEGLRDVDVGKLVKTFRQGHIKPDKNLTQEDWQTMNERFIKAIGAVWQDFYYGGKWEYNNETLSYELQDNKKDLDTKVSLYLLEKLGIKANQIAKAIPTGEFKNKGTTIDSGKKEGVTVGEEAVVIDNHQPGRGYETSAAKILHRLLVSLEVIKENGAMRALVELSVDDDNGRLIVNKDQFDKSNKTLRGLHRYLSAAQLYNFIETKWKEYNRQVGQDIPDRGKKIYEMILDAELSQFDIKNYGLQKGSFNQTNTIKNDHKWLLDVPDGELFEQGKMINTKCGLSVVQIDNKIDNKTQKKLYGGYTSAKADGRAELYIAYDPNHQSIFINALNKKIDVSKVFADFVKAHPEVVPVRGMLLIKPRDGKELSFTFEELMSELGVKAEDYKGQILQEIEREKLVKEKCASVVTDLEKHSNLFSNFINNIDKK